MKRTIIIVYIIFVITASCVAQESDKLNAELKKELALICSEYDIPALAAAVVKSDGIEKIAAYGINKLGTSDSVSIQSKFHIGSCGKSFNGLVALKLVNKSIISWETKPVDVFPEIKNTIHRDYQNITFLDLMTHRSGMPGYMYWDEKESIPKFVGTEDEKRKQTSFWQLKQKSGSEQGEFKYSNMGYVVAASLMEELTGKTWEELVDEYVFNPMEIKSFGFGRPALNDEKQPWGHWQQWQGQTDQVSVKPNEFALESIERPAGDVHLSFIDFAKYAQHHLKGLQGKSTYADKDFFNELHTIRDEYALGWGEQYRYGERCSIHYGSEATFFAVVVIFHEIDLAIVIVANSATQEAKHGVGELLKSLY